MPARKLHVYKQLGYRLCCSTIAPTKIAEITYFTCPNVISALSVMCDSPELIVWGVVGWSTSHSTWDLRKVNAKEKKRPKKIENASLGTRTLKKVGAFYPHAQGLGPI